MVTHGIRLCFAMWMSSPRLPESDMFEENLLFWNKAVEPHGKRRPSSNSNVNLY